MKKTICSILALICALMLMPTGFVVQAEDASDYTNNLQKLNAFDIYVDSNLEADEYVSRAAFIKTILSFTNDLPSNVTETETGFNDVDKYHPYAPYIKKGADLGFMNGYENGSFSPEAQITYNQAIKVLVNALGYEVSAESRGGYPNGYLAVAQSIDLTKNTTMDEEGITAELFAKLLLNACECSPFETQWEGSTVIKVVNDEVNALWKFHNILKIKDVIKANEVSGIAEEKNQTMKGYVLLGDEQVLCGKTNAKEYLGYSVEAYVYYEEDDSDGEIRYITEGRKNKTLTIDARDILSDDHEFSGYSFVYETEDGIRKTIKINSNINVIYNGIAKLAYTVDDIAPTIGEVTFIDNDGNNVYDCISIFNANKVIIVNNVINDKDGDTLVDRFNADNMYLYSNEYDLYNITLDGNENNVSCFAENMLVLIGDNNVYDADGKTVTKNGDYSITRAFGSQAICQGVISSLSGEYVYVDDNRYELAPNVKGDKLELGSMGSFWTYDGYIFGFKKGSITVNDETLSPAEYSYAYFISGSIFPSEETAEEVFMLKLLTEINEIEKIYVDKDSKINGTKNMSIDKKAAVLAQSRVGDDFVWNPQLVLYNLNKEGTIKELYTVGDTEGKLRYEGNVTSGTDGYVKVTKDGKEYSYSKGQYGQYTYYINNWMNAYYQNSDTLVFRINDNDLEESYVTGPFDNNINSEGNYDVDMYNVNEDTSAVEAVIIHTASGVERTKVQGEAIPAIVKNVEQVLDEDDNPTKSIICDKLGTTVALEWNDKLSDELKDVFESLEPGDIIFYETDVSGKLSNITKSFEYAKRDQFGMATMNDYDYVHGNWNMPIHLQRRAAYVQITQKLPGDYIGYKDNQGMECMQKIEPNTEFYKMSVNGSKVYVENIKYSDIKNGDKVYFLITYTRMTKCIVIDAD